MSFIRFCTNAVLQESKMYCDLVCRIKGKTQTEGSIQKENPTRCNIVPKFCYSIFIWSSTCFGRHTAHHQELNTALAASGFTYVEGCWTCSWWSLLDTLCPTTSTSYTSNSLLRKKNQRLLMQF
jgi:hypothetical protein